MKIRSRSLALLILASVVVGAGCGRVRAKSAFQDGNKFYKEENFKKAIEQYQQAVELDPGMAEARFYLGSSHQALYRPGKDTPENRQRIEQAIENYGKALEINDGSSESLKRVRQNTLGALTGIYSEDPFKDYDKALGFAKQLVESNPNDSKNLFAMANLYEKFQKVDEAEKMYRQVVDLNPKDTKACAALAGFYNKPLWDGRSKFDQAIEILDTCATLSPADASGFYKVASFYWDKAYRDPLLNDKQKDDYADKGLAAVDKALSVNPAYIDAIVYKGLLYRVKAQVSTNPRLRQQYLDQAATLQKQAVELKKELAAAAPAPAAAAGTK